MSKYGSKYQIQFKNQERDAQNLANFVGQTVDIGIYDRSNIVDDSVTQTVYNLTPSGDPFHLSSVDNSEDKFTPIRAIQATFQFLSDDEFTLETFTDSPVIGTDPGDPRWYVEVIVNSKMVFKGFLVLDDCYCAFMPTPNTVTLVATDGLGWLKNIDLATLETFKTFKRSSTVTENGHWGSNTTVLNTSTNVTLEKRDLSGNDIDWVINAISGQQFQVTLSTDPTVSCIYQISSILLDLPEYRTFVVTFISGSTDSIVADSFWYINLVGASLTDAPMGHFRIADFLAWCLLKTGLTLDLKVVFNIRDESSKQFSTSSHFTASSHTIGVAEPAYFFYAGQVLTVSGTASNNGNVTVLTVVNLGFFGTLLTVAETLVDEDVIATYQDTKFHFFDKMYLDAHTFEGDEVGKTLNCYDVISRILGDEAFLTQRSGVWWIYRIDETELNVQYNIATFYPDGSLKDFLTNSSYYGQFIAKDFQTKFFSQERTEYTQNSQYKFNQEDYKFEYPKEIPCNSDFSRGDFVTDLANENDENGNPCTVKKYNLDCWTMKRGFPLHSPVTNDSTDFIKRLFNSNDYEVQRYVVVTWPSANDAINQPYIECEPIPIQTKDKITISVDYRFPTSISTGSGFFKIMYVVLKGDDGSYWLHGRDEPANSGAQSKWYDTSGFTANTELGENSYNWATTESGVDWNTQEFVCQPAPVSGNIYIWLHGMNFNAAGFDDVDIYYTNLSVSYFPYINGSYQKYNGIHIKTSRDINFRATREKQVYISDGIKPLFKGALFVNHGAFVLVNRFFNWKAAPAPTSDQIHPYLVLQGFDVWNQYRNVMKTFHATIQGLSTHVVGSDGELYHPALIHTYYFDDAHPAAYNRRFMLLAFDQNWYTCEWTGTFAEVYRVDVPKNYDDPTEVKYD